MDPQPDVIREQIDETRSALTEKLETLEAEVKGTVQSARDTVESARDAVADTITNVKETVHQATETVKRTFDIRLQVNRHPWAMLGLSLVSGLAAGALVGGQRSGARRMAQEMSEASGEPLERDDTTPAAAWSQLTRDHAGRTGFMDQLGHKLGDEFEKVKDLAIDSLVGVAGNVARMSIPALATVVEDMMSRVAEQAGAVPPQYGSERPDIGI